MFLCVIFLSAALTTIWEVSAVGQGTEGSRQLERVEIPAPDRRPAARVESAADSGYAADQTPSPDASSYRGRGAAAGFGGGSDAAASTLSLVTGKPQVSLGATSLPAQVQTISPQDIQQLVVERDYANLFRQIAGVKAVNYGQGQLGTMVNMRGCKSSAGNEVAIFIDGVPQNYPCLTMNHGASEISWLSPELIEKIEIIKGPFSSLYGDFALGGVVNIVTKRSDPRPSVKAEGGRFGNFRALGIISSDAWIPTPLLAEDYYTINGYRDNSQLNQWSPFNKVSCPLWGGILSLRYNYFQAYWGAPGYWPIDWVKSGLVDPKWAYNTADGGRNRLYQLVLNYAPACGERGLYVTLYGADFHHQRYYTFLPLNSSQSGRQDDRRYWGGRMYYNLVFGDIGSLTVGAETRQDSGETQQYTTVNRQRMTTTYDYNMRLSDWAVFLQGQIKPVEWLKIVGGVRWDCFTQDFDNLGRPQNSGKGFPFIQSPKIGFVMTPTTNFNIFGNIGCGFRSPSYLEVSPYQANTTPGFGLQPAGVQTYDVGFNIALFGNLYLAADYYHTYMQRLIQLVNNNPVVVGDTVRKGYELEAKYFPSENIDIFASYAWVDAKVIDPATPGQYLVTDISEHTIKAGVTMSRDFGPYGKVIADLYYEYFSGPPFYNGSTLIFGRDFDDYNFKLTYSGRGWSSFFSAKCRPREYACDAYWVNTGYLMYDPQPKWDLGAGISYSF